MKMYDEAERERLDMLLMPRTPERTVLPITILDPFPPEPDYSSHTLSNPIISYTPTPAKRNGGFLKPTPKRTRKRSAAIPLFSMIREAFRAIP